MFVHMCITCNFPAHGGLSRVVPTEWREQKLCWWGVAGRGLLGGSSADRRGEGPCETGKGCENLGAGGCRSSQMADSLPCTGEKEGS